MGESHPGMTCRHGEDEGDALYIGRQAMNRQSQTAEKRWSFKLREGRGADNFAPYTNLNLTEYCTGPRKYFRAFVSTVMNLNIS